MYVYSWVPNPEFGGGGGRGGAEMGKEIGQCWWMLYHIEFFFQLFFCVYHRRMFPSIDITVTGLNPNVSYIMIMDVVAVSNWRYKYLEQEWVVSRPSTGAPFTDYYVHPKSPALGAYWMEQDISFGGMKLTNLEEKSEGMVRG